MCTAPCAASTPRIALPQFLQSGINASFHRACTPTRSFRSQVSGTQLRELRFVTLAFGEWLMGLPWGWTALKPLGRAALEANQKDLSGGAPGVLAGAPRDFRSLSLFSGCGALDYALPGCAPV